VIARLAAAYRVVAYDLRGHGRSAQSATNDYDIPAQAADLDAVLTATVGHDEQAVLVGHSLGGQVILTRAQHRLDCIGAVVSSARPARGKRHPDCPAPPAGTTPARHTRPVAADPANCCAWGDPAARSRTPDRRGSPAYGFRSRRSHPGSASGVP
jgi:pimeloyl-ACP methyl ester carboxylesterase